MLLRIEWTRCCGLSVVCRSGLLLVLLLYVFSWLLSVGCLLLCVVVCSLFRLNVLVVGWLLLIVLLFVMAVCGWCVLVAVGCCCLVCAIVCYCVMMFGVVGCCWYCCCVLCVVCCVLFVVVGCSWLLLVVVCCCLFVCFVLPFVLSMFVVFAVARVL